MNKLIFIVAISLFFSCNKVKETAKATINKSGEVVGKTATEFVEGVTEGVDRTLDCKIELSKNLIDCGLKTGKFTIENDSVGNQNNKMVVYLIFDKEINRELFVKVLDKKGVESGRCKINVEGKIGDAKYYDVVFDKRTNIETKSILKFE